MEWVQRLQELTGWQGPAWECDWRETESQIGVPLPADYKELCATFGPGDFAGYVEVLTDRGPAGGTVLSWWQSLMDDYGDDPEDQEMFFGPHIFYGPGSPRGLILWGFARQRYYLYWLADAEVDPGSWPILAKTDFSPDGVWFQYDMSVPEFVYHLLTDTTEEYAPFSLERPASEWPRTFNRINSPIQMRSQRALCGTLASRVLTCVSSGAWHAFVGKVK